MSIVTIAAVIAVVILPPILQATAVVILHAASRASDNPILALLERLRVAQCGLVGSFIISGLAVNGVLGRPVPIAPPGSTLLVALALLIMSAPAGVFVWLYWTGRFGDDPPLT